MIRITVRREIGAEPTVVFAAVTDVDRIREISPDVLDIEFLSEQHSGVGTRFRETRRMGSRQMDTELEVTVFEPPRRARMVADSHGTVWDTLFEVDPAGTRVTLSMTMEARSRRLFPKLINRLFAGRYRDGMEKHIEAVKTHSETRAE